MEAVHPLRRVEVRVFREVIDGGKRGLASYRSILDLRRGTAMSFTGSTFEEARGKAEAWREAELGKHEASFLARREAAAKRRKEDAA